MYSVFHCSLSDTSRGLSLVAMALAIGGVVLASAATAADQGYDLTAPEFGVAMTEPEKGSTEALAEAVRAEFARFDGADHVVKFDIEIGFTGASASGSRFVPLDLVEAGADRVNAAEPGFVFGDAAQELFPDFDRY